ncbi:MAG TPA: class I cytochrome c [Burkholderiales bacterium]|nr:class I cytochrome c [Burkholderiales bacterium]
MRQIVSIALVAGLAWTPFSQAQDAGEAAVKKLGCLKCHSVSADKDGPSFKKSAAKYKGEGGKLEAFLKSGKDKHAVVKSDADVKSISAYILSR